MARSIASHVTGLIRYPGSKAKLAMKLVRLIPHECWGPLFSQHRWEYREPFFGAGAVGFRVLTTIDKRCPVWLNDIDTGIVALWRAILNEPDRLRRLVATFTPSVDLFFDYKEQDGNGHIDDADVGFRKLALHRMSVSGFGAMAGGPIGGKTQKTSGYTVDCRWNAETIRKRITRINRLFKAFASLRITRGDFAVAMSADDTPCFYYLDPPYYAKGSQLYVHAMSDDCHKRLAEILKQESRPWLLSYDDAPIIRELYGWAKFTELEVTYTNATWIKKQKRPKNREVAITPLHGGAHDAIDSGSI